MHQTLKTFEYPQSLIKEYDHWAVVTRRKQVTAASLVLICKEDVTAFSDVSAAGMAELKNVISDIEHALTAAIDYEKINYLMLMMVDPHVHFHVFPRYKGAHQLNNVAVIDHGWPGQPDLAKFVELDDEALKNTTKLLKSFFDKTPSA